MPDGRQLNSNNMVAIQRVCAFTAQTVRKMIQGCKNPIAGGDFKWIFACNCEGTEQLRSVLLYNDRTEGEVT